MMFPSVYQHRLEDYQPMMNPPHYESNYPELQHLPLSTPSNIWLQHHDNYQYKYNEYDASAFIFTSSNPMFTMSSSQYVPGNSYGMEMSQNQLNTQGNQQKKKNSQKTTPAYQQKATANKRKTNSD